MKYAIFIFMIYTCLYPAFAQGQPSISVSGAVYGLHFHEAGQDTVPLAAANIYWAGTAIGTTSDNEGHFQIPFAADKNRLVIRYIGYENDTLVVNSSSFLTIYLKTLRTLDEVSVEADKPFTIQQQHAIVNTQSITQRGLQTLACCNLAESFENTTAVDVEQTDAVSGAKRIKMLGLAGFYSQILIEKNPLMRGLISPFGLEYIPGYWIDSIDISKGTASVATGYESITGQINVELKKPENGKPLELNAYQSNMGRSELTLSAARHVSEKVSTMLLSYGSYNQHKWDQDADTFIDMPLVTHLNVLNRWKYHGEHSDGQLGIKIIHDNRDGGQTNFDFDHPQPSASIYGSRNRINRYEFFSKAGTLLGHNGSSLGLILSGSHHRQESFWGMKSYSGDETSIYANLVYEKIGPMHSFSSGLSYRFDNRDESYQRTSYLTDERVPGLFLEYTYKLQEKLTAMAGFRYDHHSLYGPFYTPRFHLKYQPDAETSVRFSAGKGYRVPHMFMDNPAILASSRELIQLESLKAEEAWNAGVQILRDFRLGADNPATLTIDFYRTEFQNQVVVDMEQSARSILLYNLNGRSYSNSAQAELTATAAKGLSITAAYRLNDVKTTYLGNLQELPLNAKHKGLLVTSYTLPKEKWRLDFTAQFNGSTRLPNTSMNPIEYQLDSFSPNYVLLFAQITRKMSRMDVYAGIENITDYRQPMPILAWNDPFSPYFDSSLIWGPTVGRRFYIGLRWN